MANLLESSARAIVGKSDGELFGSEAGDHLKEVDARVLRGEVIEEEHTRPIRGQATTFLDIRFPLRNAEDDVTGICGISRNVTERTVLLQRLVPSPGEYESPAMQATMVRAALAAETDGTILLTGESGVGKDYFARYLHDHSKRSAGPFYAINCAAVPPDLAESELFGHEPGAFTGAIRRKRGLLELAEGGTLLLNEIGELALPLQAKLLSFLDSRTFTRVGGEKSVTVNARVIAATNRELREEAAQGRFRQDLLFRLDVFDIRVPPLRERIEDIPLLAQQILSKLADEMQLTRLPHLQPAIEQALCRYSWPGNVRELRNVLERALILCQGQAMQLEHLCFGGPEAFSQGVKLQLPTNRSMFEVVHDVERGLIVEALRRCGGNKQQAAQALGITRHALARHAKKLGILGTDRE
jgi:DNA-binding NtrC family response regulator